MTIAEGITAFSALTAAVVFFFGVSAWKREFVGKRRIELAEDVLALAYEVQEIIKFIRSPFSSTTEGKSRARNDRETAEETELLNQAYVVFERYDKMEDRLAKFKALKYRFMATFGPDSGASFEEIGQVINDIFLASRRLGSHYWPRQGRVEMTQDEFEKHLAEMHQHEHVFWYMGEENDEIGPRVVAAIQAIEQHAMEAAQRPAIFHSAWIDCLPKCVRTKLKRRIERPARPAIEEVGKDAG